MIVDLDLGGGIMSPPSSDHGDSIAEHHDTSKIQV